MRSVSSSVEVLGITKAKAPPAEMTPLLEPLRGVGRAIGDYMLQVVATADRERPDTIESAQGILSLLISFGGELIWLTPMPPVPSP